MELTGKPPILFRFAHHDRPPGKRRRRSRKSFLLVQKMRSRRTTRQGGGGLWLRRPSRLGFRSWMTQAPPLRRTGLFSEARGHRSRPPPLPPAPLGAMHRTQSLENKKEK